MELSIVEESGLSDVGRHRQGNEDSYLMAAPVYAVADGMGGARAGEVASRIAVEAFEGSGAADRGPEERLAAIAHAANRRIHELAQADEAHSGMGTTLSAVIVDGDEVSIGHVGDSRVYRLRDGELERLTTDHSYVQELVAQGRLTPEEAEVHPQNAIITRALGPEPDVDVDTFTLAGRDGDVYLICSDGLTGMLPEPRVAEILGVAGSLEDASHALVAGANDNGGRDNITVVLFRLGYADEKGRGAPAEPDTLTGAEADVDAQRVRTAVIEAGRAAAEERSVLAEPAAAAEPPRAPAVRRRAPRRRRALWTSAGVVLVAAALGGAFVLSRQVHFIGTDAAGVLTVDRGLPYAPLGVELHGRRYVSPVRASSLDPLRRATVLDRRWRSRADAFDLIRSIERTDAGRRAAGGGA